MSTNEPVIGIDLGTSTSCAAIVGPQGLEILADQRGRFLTPSCVAFTADGERVGEEARPYLITEPHNTIYSFKRIMGSRFDDHGVRTAISGYPYRIAEGPNKSVVVEVRGQTLALPEVAARVLRRIRQTAEERLETPVKKAVCAVPSTFNDAQRAATRIAGRIAGLDFIHLINEPTAAALAFGHDRRETELVCVYDFGGGTFDFTVLEMEGRVLRVVAADGDPFLGGDDLDRAMALTAAELFRRQTGRHLWNEVAEWQRLLFECEAAKCRLSTEMKTEVRVPEVVRTVEGTQDLVFPLNRKMLAHICRENIKRSLELCREVLRGARIAAQDIDAVVLVGGTTQSPNVRAAVAQFFGQRPDISVNPLQAVAYGAALQAATMSGHSMPQLGPRKLLEMTTNSLGVSTGGALHIVVGPNEMLPVSATRTFTTSTDGQSAMTLSIFQGRGTRPEDWGYLGDIMIDGIRAGAAGSVSIEVTFEINEQNRVSAEARDPVAGTTINCRLGADRQKQHVVPDVEQALKNYLAENKP